MFLCVAFLNQICPAETFSVDNYFEVIPEIKNFTVQRKQLEELIQEAEGIRTRFRARRKWVEEYNSQLGELMEESKFYITCEGESSMLVSAIKEGVENLNTRTVTLSLLAVAVPTTLLYFYFKH